MAQETVNPYSELGIQHTAGLTFVASTIVAATMNDLINAVYAYIQPIYLPAVPTPKETEIETKSIIAHAVNGYINSMLSTEGLNSYTGAQMKFIHYLIKGIDNVPQESLKSWITDLENNITKSDLSYQEQVPLLLTTVQGIAAVDYWVAEIAAGAPGVWGPYMPTDTAVSTATLLRAWVKSGMIGSLLVANTSLSYPLMDTNSRPNPGIDIIAAVTAGIAVSAGKVILDYIPRIQNDVYKSDYGFNDKVQGMPVELINPGGR
jgi:hypothetical protein